MSYTDTQLELMVCEIDESGADLNDWELDFISSLIDDEVKVFSIRQAAKIEEIYAEKL